MFSSVSFPKQTFINQTNFVDKLLLVMGGDAMAPDFNLIEPLAELVYATALQRGYTPDNIRVLHPDETRDLDNAGTADDVFDLPSLLAIEDAISTWAADANRLAVFLIADNPGSYTGTVTASGFLDQPFMFTLAESMFTDVTVELSSNDAIFFNGFE